MTKKISLMLLILAAGIAGAQAQGNSYQIQPGDVLHVSVWNEPTLDLDVMVGPDGWLHLPLVGGFDSTKQTIETLQAAMSERIRGYIPDAVVTIAAKHLAGNKIYILGQVNRPGEFAINRPTDVLQALALAGGAGRFADVDDIKILRREMGKVRTFNFDYDEVIRGRKLEQNLQLQSGDVIVVP